MRNTVFPQNFTTGIDAIMTFWAPKHFHDARDLQNKLLCRLMGRGGVEGTRLEAKDTKKKRFQGHNFRGQTLSRPRTGFLEAKDQGHNVEVFSKKKFFAQKNCKVSAKFKRSQR